MQLDDAIRKRHSIRRYSSKPVSWEQIVKILDAATYSPMAGNIYTIRLILVSEKEKIQEIARAAVQDFIASAPYLVVVCSDNTQVTRIYEERGLRYSRQQAGAAIENILLKITDLGLASVWISAYDDDAIKRILQIPEHFEIEAILPIAKKPVFVHEVGMRKPDLQNILFFEKYGQRTAKPVRRAEAK